MNFFLDTYTNSIGNILDYSYQKGIFSKYLAHTSMQIIRHNTSFLSYLCQDSILFSKDKEESFIKPLNYILENSNLLQNIIDSCYPDNKYDQELVFDNQLKCRGILSSFVNFISIFKDDLHIVYVNFSQLMQEKWKITDLYQYSYPNGVMCSERAHVSLQIILQKNYLFESVIRNIIQYDIQKDHIELTTQHNNMTDIHLFLKSLLLHTSAITGIINSCYPNNQYNIELVHQSFQDISEKIKTVSLLLEQNRELFYQPIQVDDTTRQKNNKFNQYKL